MIALDTNVLVRFLVEDDEVQSARAARLVQRAIAAAAPLFVSDVALCEVVWVLRISYKVARRDVADVLRKLLHAKHLVWSSQDVLLRALDAYESGRGDFADYVIREQALRAGCERVATFDRTLLAEDGFEAP